MTTRVRGSRPHAPFAAALSLPMSASISGAAAQALGPTLSKIKETGIFTIGNTPILSVPFSYLDDNQKPVGFSIDLCTRRGRGQKPRSASPT